MTTIAASAVLALLPLAAPPAVADGAAVPWPATFSGTFSLGVEDGVPTLRFSGSGTGRQTGLTTVVGVATLGETDARGCTPLVEDSVVLTAADGSTLRLTNEAVDCLDGATISGGGACTVTGGSGRFAGAAGSGEVSTKALSTGGLPDGTATGTFEPLRFEGTLAR